MHHKFQIFPLWLVETQTIPGPVWEPRTLPLLLLSGTLGGFLTCICWSWLNWRLKGDPKNLWSYFPVFLSPLHYSALWNLAVLASPHTKLHFFNSRRHQALPDFPLPALKPGNSLREVNWSNWRAHLCKKTKRRS